MFILMPDYNDMPLIFCSTKTYSIYHWVRMLPEPEKDRRHKVYQVYICTLYLHRA